MEHQIASDIVTEFESGMPEVRFIDGDPISSAFNLFVNTIPEAKVQLQGDTMSEPDEALEETFISFIKSSDEIDLAPQISKADELSIAVFDSYKDYLIESFGNFLLEREG